ncbi:hypothetical protein CEXT_233721 [Caerostris extrusa]|uniref:Uncharacterized protein n=1 Tax=Caerostris extrusa TaxID=172846 RepID=A0AAV4VXF7_CAEEX|nr:hypothetical protein CEXT_233721 [Caerostris extrusa]
MKSLTPACPIFPLLTLRNPVTGITLLFHKRVSASIFPRDRRRLKQKRWATDFPVFINPRSPIQSTSTRRCQQRKGLVKYSVWISAEVKPVFFFFLFLSV